MAVDRLYQEVIMRHAGNPIGLGGLEGDGVITEKRNPLCGDTVRLRHDHDHILGAEARGCALCMASTSIMAQSVGKHVVAIIVPTHDWLEGLMAKSPKVNLAELFGDDRDALAVVKDVRARMQCVSLPWLLAKEVFDHER
jgi:NifU homolog involved in Fe-S cluster formation